MPTIQERTVPAAEAKACRRRRRCHCGAALAIALLISGAAPAEPDAEKRADILKLLTLMRAENVALEFAATKIDYLLVYAHKAKPYIKAEAMQNLRTELLAEMAQRVWQSGSFAGLTIELWDERFTHDEIKALIGFYSSDVGQKLVSLDAELAKKQRAAGRTWGSEMEAIIADRVREKLGELERKSNP